MSPQPLNPRETYQTMRDIVLGIRAMRRVSEQNWSSAHCGLVTVEVDGWVLTFYNNYGELGHCASCYDPDGRELVSDATKRIDTDPAELLSPLERQQLEALLGKI